MREQLKRKEKNIGYESANAIEERKSSQNPTFATDQVTDELTMDSEISTLNDKINKEQSRTGSSVKNNTDSALYSASSSKKDPAEKEAYEASKVYVSGSPILSDNNIETAKGISIPPQVLKLIDGQAGKGVQIAPETLEDMNLFFEEDFSDVQVHSGPVSNLLCTLLNCYAFAYGKDVFFKSGHYAPGTEGGRELLVHELTHVVQQRGQMPVVQLFEAPWHESASRSGLSKDGFAQEEITQIYFGNWMRDMNQVFVPALKDYGINNDVVLGVINYLAFKKFGKEITAEQFGFYMPDEHIDNPAGQLIGLDLLSKGPTVPIDSKVHTIDSSPLPSVLKTQNTSNTIGGVPIFDVDSTGVMAYIRKTNVLVEKRLELAVGKGRTPEGRMHLGAAMHSMEDLFAHSNFVEIALNQLLKEEGATLLPQLQGEERKVNTLSPEVKLKNGDTRSVLTTGTFTGTDTIVSIGHEAVKFMKEGLPTNVTEADNDQAQKLTQRLLDNFADKLEKDPNVRALMKEGLNKVPGLPTFVINEVIKWPLHNIYRAIGVYRKYLPDLSFITNSVNNTINTVVLNPAADQVESIVLETQTSNTTLAKNLEAQQAVIDSEGKITAEEYLGNVLGEQDATAQRAIARTSEAKKRKSHLKGLPDQVLATASHSQLAKDHSNSPLFALGFTLAAEADRRIGQKLLQTPQWNQKPEITAAYDKELIKVSVKGIEATDESVLEKILKSYGKSSFEISSLSKEQKVESVVQLKLMVDQSQDSLGNATGVQNMGKGGSHEESVEVQQQQASKTIENVANAIELIIGSPQAGMKALTHIKSMVTEQEHKHGNSSLLINRSKDYVSQVQKGLGQVDKITKSFHLHVIVNFLRKDAKNIKDATTFEAREKAYKDLRIHQQYYLNWVGGQIKIGALSNPGIDTHSAALLVLNRAITSTAPSFTQKQLDAIAGKGFVPNDRLKVSDQPVQMNSLSDHPPALRALLEESRKLITHPKESNWWKPMMKAFIKKHPKKVMENIKARNAGIGSFRKKGGHGH